MKLTGAGGHLCAIHVGADGRPHPHVWEVRAWVEYGGRDAEKLRDELAGVLARWDHGTLPAKLSRAEDIAQAIGESIPGCILVELDRPVEQLFARWEPCEHDFHEVGSVIGGDLVCSRCGEERFS